MTEAATMRREDRKSPSTRLESALLHAYRQSPDLPLKVAASVYAALDFAINGGPSPARVEHSRRSAIEAFDNEGAIERFAELLRAESPRGQSLAADKAVLRAAGALIADSLRRGQLERLSEIGPELVQLVLLPYLGFAEAKRWATSTAR